MTRRETVRQGKRWRVLPDHGTLLVHTDLHGNGEDFRRLKKRFFELREQQPQTHWVILGDIVHGPCPEANERHPDIYGYRDESWEIVAELTELTRTYPDHVHFVLGNHDFAHLGGPRTRRFYPDEVDALESRLTPQQVMYLHDLLHAGLLAVAAPCGMLMTHGCPSDALTDLRQLDAIAMPPAAEDRLGRQILGGVLFAYGQRHDVTQRLLAGLSSENLELALVVHGHDRDRKGWFSEWDNQLCVLLFGSPPRARRYLELDLSARYRGVRDLRHGHEILRLYPELDEELSDSPA